LVFAGRMPGRSGAAAVDGDPRGGHQLNRTRGWNDTGIDYPSDLGCRGPTFPPRQTDFGDTSLPLPDLALSPTVRGILTPYLEAFRMCGQPVVLTDAQEVGVFIAFSIQVNANYFQSEVRLAVEQTLGTGPEGFFSPGKLGFGEDLCASDLYQALMNVDGVDNVCIKQLETPGVSATPTNRVRVGLSCKGWRSPCATMTRHLQSADISRSRCAEDARADMGNSSHPT